jgi:hypothetical protein
MLRLSLQHRKIGQIDGRTSGKSRASIIDDFRTGTSGRTLDDL